MREQNLPLACVCCSPLSVGVPRTLVSLIIYALNGHIPSSLTKTINAMFSS